MKARVANTNLADRLDQFTTIGAPELCRPEGNRMRCLACGHRCLIGPGLRGICKVRFEADGQLHVPYGYVAGVQCDPVEKKPFFHVYPGSDALTFGMMGCDLHCSYCQNWLTSQALRDPDAGTALRSVTPTQLVETARREGARLVVSSYNEPLITAEWAVSVFQEAKAVGLACAFVSNGNATPEVLDYLKPWIVAYKVDLKSFNDQNYRSLGGTLENVLQTIRMIHERGLWLEVVTLIIPGFNDSDEELRQIAEFLASVSPDIPWHVTAFHQDYRMTDPETTPADTLIRAAEIGTAAGLRYIYAGNLPGRVGPWENTRCPSCRTTMVERYGYLIRSYQLTPDGRCPHCQTALPGIWPQAVGAVKTGNDLAAYHNRLPRPVATTPGTFALPVVTAPQPRKDTPAMTSVRSSLSAEQQQQIATAAVGMVRTAVSGLVPAFPAELAALGRQPMAGAFLSLKRGKHLRSCSGLLGQPVPLQQALTEAIQRTVWEDTRFPPISPTELEHLRMEVWLLNAPQRVEAKGEDRLNAITLGQHGVRVVRDQAHGLFLPSVPTENNWDVRRTLDQVCLKAGLFPTAWKEDDTALYTFEGTALTGVLAGAESHALAAARTRVCTEDDVNTFVEACRRNIIAILTGATPNYFLWGAPDGMVNGLVLSWTQPGSTEVVNISQIALRPGIPLQTTLFSLAQAAAQTLARQRLTLEFLQTTPLGLSLLLDPILHGTVADPHLEELATGQRALFVQERNKSALRSDPSQTAAQLLDETAKLAQVSQPERAAVFSFDLLTNLTEVCMTTAPRPVRGPAVRPAAVAGKFYDANPDDLAKTVDQLLAGETAPEAWSAAMVPHAGLRYSGQIAADVLRAIRIPKTVIVIGPKHTSMGVDWAVAPHQTWDLPGLSLESDFMLARKLCQAIPGLEMDAIAHQQEHAIEVELPLLARLAPESKVLGIAIGHGDLESCKAFAAGLAGLIKESSERPLLLISSDMNHFATDAENRRLDGIALTALARGNADDLYETVTRQNISMCGLLPAVIVLETLRLLNWDCQTKQVGYATTADVTGDTRRVVGYAGMLFR